MGYFLNSGNWSMQRVRCESGRDESLRNKIHLCFGEDHKSPGPFSTRQKHILFDFKRGTV